MPAKYEIDKGNRLVVVTGWDHCTAYDALEIRKAIESDPDFDPSFSELADCTGITKVDATPDEIRMLAADSPFSMQSRRALVAGNQITFVLAKTFSILRSLRGERHVRVFRSRDEALAWLLEKRKAA